MAQPPTIGRPVIDSIEPILALFKARGVNLALTGTRKKAGTYTNGNTRLENCDEFTLTSERGKVSHDIERGATVTFYQQPHYGGIQTLCLVEDHVGFRTFTITGERTCRIRDTHPVQQPSPLPLNRVLNF